MSSKVGTKGQIVISKEIRDQLGLEPGWMAIQRVVDGHLEVHFVPPEHNRSLLGILSKYVTKSLGEGEEWDRAREAAWEEAALDRVRRMKEEEEAWEQSHRVREQE